MNMTSTEPYQNHNCLNCDAPLSEKFCAQCGQKDVNPHMDFRTMAQEFIGGFFAFDARVYRTLKLLILKPGMLTQDYLRGKRQRYVPPFKLYLFATFLAFLLLNFVDARVLKFNSVNQGGNGVSFQRNENANHDSESGKGPSENPTEKESVNKRETVVENNPEDATVLSAEPGLPVSDTNGSNTPPQNVSHGQDSESDSDENFLGRLFSGMAKASEDPKQANREMVQLLPKGMFLMLPLFALLLRVFYKSSKFRYPQWFVFSLYFHAFVFFFLTIGAVFIHFGWLNIFRIIICLVMPVYLFVALRRITEQSLLVTILKLWGFLTLYLLSLMITLLSIGIWIILQY